MTPIGLRLRVAVVLLVIALAGVPVRAADDPRVADLVKARLVRVALDIANPLLAVRDPLTTEYQGITVGFAGALAARIGVPLRALPFDKPPEILIALRDRALDAGFLAIDPVRTLIVDYSPALVEVDNAYLVSPGSPVREIGDLDGAGVRIAVIEGYGADLFLTRVLRRASVVRAGSLEAALDLVITGRADLMVGHLPSLRGLTPRLPGARLLVDRLIGESYGIAVPKGRPGWLAYVTQFVEDAKASGLVQRGITEQGLDGVRVAPPAPRESSAPR